MSIRVEQGGLLTTVQDMGRTGYQQYGMSVAGVLDQRAAALANFLVGNVENEAVLEVSLLGPRLLFTQDNCIALTGGDLGAELDGAPVPLYAAVAARKGQILSFTGPKSGCRAYLAFAGGLDIPIVMGSRSTFLKSQLGGYQGRQLSSGDEIAFRAPRPILPMMSRRRLMERTASSLLRVVLGPQDDAFTPEGLETFLSSEYTLTNQFDRMGCRLDGPVIAHRAGADILSDGISFGAVQVPSSGKPILMLADRQTVGGYTKIACVISADFSALAQAKAGDRFRFEAVSMEQAQALYIAQRQELSGINRSLNAGVFRRLFHR
ncbi:biotin-dependent carboxyltransferase family protein [Oscillibacter sp. MSJ-2]|uniref:Biotin-dependent carboxyltransferase family protein n=1 Tax=Dysosmobacter acutus TaxID=2841504 RepID=A0ABS6F6M4_9FIRM|nr:biotin-dependent carboxyltransferase family protein [Dysosmobacter acutus]